METTPILVALIAGIAAIGGPLALEMYRMRVKARDEARTRERTEDAARRTIRALKSEIRELKEDRREDRAFIRTLMEGLREWSE